MARSEEAKYTMSKKKHMGLRFTSAALCLSILAAGVAANWTPVKGKAEKYS